MKICTKYLIVIILSLVFMPITFANSINTDDLDFNKMRFSPTENPVAYNYMNAYAKQLSDSVDLKKFRRTWLAHYYYRLNTDGTISNLQVRELNSPPKNKKINKYFEEFLTTTCPPPFPKDMEIGAVNVEFLMENKRLEEDISVFFDRIPSGTIYPGNQMYINIDKKG